MQENLSQDIWESTWVLDVCLLMACSWIVGTEKSRMVQAAFLGCAILLVISVAVFISQRPGHTGEQ